ncbi:SNF2 family N-terminal domain-containing protein, partial [Tribonema minus]
EAIAIAAAYADEWPLLVLCPTALRDNWRNELLKWVPRLCSSGVTVVKDSSSELCTSNGRRQAFVVTYGLLPRLVANGHLHAGQFRVVCADESHMLKTAGAQRTQSALPILREATRAICLSGTPVLSRPAEVCIMTRPCDSTSCWSHDNFLHTALAHHPPTPVHMPPIAPSAGLILESTIMIRRLKEQVLSQMLPEKRREIIHVAVARDSRQELSALLSQRSAIVSAMSDPNLSREQLARAKSDQQALTARLCKLTGVAKVCT